MNSPTAVRTPVSPVFVGREAELAQLLHAAEAADSGEPQALLIGGEAGVGKTRLVEELLSSLDRETSVVAVGGCIEVGGGRGTPVRAGLRRPARPLGAAAR
ncbi:ATP-binding protein [Streptomyces sp. NPDC055722]